MPKLRFRISISLDGYTAGPRQSVKDPLGEGGERLHEWVFSLAAWRAAHGLEGGSVDQSTPVMEESLTNIGATIMGRNMFGGHPGPWDEEHPWNGWWGDDPPFHHPVFVLTHHAREPLWLQGGTVFTFVTEGIHAALRARVRGGPRAGRRARRGGGRGTAVSGRRAGRRDGAVAWSPCSSAGASGCSTA